MYIAVQVHFISNTVHTGQIYTRLVAGQSWWINHAVALSGIDSTYKCKIPDDDDDDDDDDYDEDVYNNTTSMITSSVGYKTGLFHNHEIINNTSTSRHLP
jgi:hypothetical protein